MTATINSSTRATSCRRSRAHDEEFARCRSKSEPRFGEGVGSHAIVMDAADRNLFQIYQSERPDLNKVIAP